MLNLKQVIINNIENKLNSLYTNLPAEVVSYSSENQTVVVKPLINYTWADGLVQEDPVVAEVPVVFPSAGGGIISFPVQAGDTVLLCFSMRSIDSWMEGDGSVSTPEENRLHDLTDAIAIPGLYPKQNTLSPNPDDVEIKFKGNRVTLKANGDVVIDGGKIELGAGATESIILGDAFQAFFNTHVHTSASAGSPTGPPTAMPDSTLSSDVTSK